MSTVPANKVAEKDKAFLACSYAMMILHDEGLEISAEKIQKLITSSGIKIQDYYSKFFSTNMAGVNLASLMKG